MRLCSVVVPVFNKEAYVRAALASACAQTHRALEIIVIDDGSVDRSLEQARSVEDPRIRIFSQRNAGVAEARNRGVESVRGEFIFFLDADDVWHPQFVSSALRVFDTFDDVVLVGADVAWTTDASEEPLRAPPIAQVTAQFVDDMAEFWLANGGQGFCTSTTALRAGARRAFSPLFPAGVSNGEDLQLWFRINREGPIALIQERMAVLRAETPNSLTASNARSSDAPFHIEMMEDCVRSGSLRAPLASSWRRFVARDHLDRALRIAERGHEARALRVVAERWGDARYARWWGILALLLVPSAMRRHSRRLWARLRRRFY